MEGNPKRPFASTISTVESDSSTTPARSTFNVEAPNSRVAAICVNHTNARYLGNSQDAPLSVIRLQMLHTSTRHCHGMSKRCHGIEAFPKAFTVTATLHNRCMALHGVAEPMANPALTHGFDACRRASDACRRVTDVQPPCLTCWHRKPTARPERVFSCLPWGASYAVGEGKISRTPGATPQPWGASCEQSYLEVSLLPGATPQPAQRGFFLDTTIDSCYISRSMNSL